MLSASKQRGKEESTTRPEAARRPFPSARLWEKLIAACEWKELPLSPARSSVSMPQMRPAGAFSPNPFFGRKAIFFGNTLDVGFIFLFRLLLIFLSKQPQHLLKAPPFPQTGDGTPHSTLGTPSAGHRGFHTQGGGDKSFCLPQRLMYSGTLESEQSDSELFVPLICLRHLT